MSEKDVKIIDVKHNLFGNPDKKKDRTTGQEMAKKRLSLRTPRRDLRRVGNQGLHTANFHQR